jgi:hypothetical protein
MPPPFLVGSKLSLILQPGHFLKLHTSTLKMEAACVGIYVQGYTVSHLTVALSEVCRVCDAVSVPSIQISYVTHCIHRRQGNYIIRWNEDSGWSW